MGIVTTYVCDATGKSGTDKSEFVEVMITSNSFYSVGSSYSSYGNLRVSKLISVEVAQKLNLYMGKKDVPVYPEVTFEGKLRALLEDFVQGIVEDNQQS